MSWQPPPGGGYHDPWGAPPAQHHSHAGPGPSAWYQNNSAPPAHPYHGHPSGYDYWPPQQEVHMYQHHGQPMQHHHPAPMPMKRSLPPQMSNAGPYEKRMRLPPAINPSSPDIVDLRAVIESKLQPVVELCVAEGITDMSPEQHGYPLSRIKGDFLAHTQRELDLNRMGGIRLSELITKYASDIATLVVTHVHAAVLLPACNRKFGSLTAPPRIAPAMSAAEVEAKKRQQQFEEQQQQGEQQPQSADANGQPAASGKAGAEPKADPDQPDGSPATRADSSGAQASTCVVDDEPIDTSQPPPQRLRQAALLYLSRRILATRFRLNQAAYSTTLLPPKARQAMGLSDPANATIPGLAGFGPSSSTSHIPSSASCTPAKRNLIREINEAAEKLAPSLGWPLESIVPDLCALADKLGVDDTTLAQLDIEAVLKAAMTDPVQNPFRLTPGEGHAAAAAAAGGKPAAAAAAVVGTPTVAAAAAEVKPAVVAAAVPGEGPVVDGDKSAVVAAAGEEPAAVSAAPAAGEGQQEAVVKQEVEVKEEVKTEPVLASEAGRSSPGKGRLALPPALAGMTLVPVLGPHRELQIVLEVWLCMRSVLTEFHPTRRKALAQAGEPPVDSASPGGNYPLERLVDDYRRQWGKVLEPRTLGFRSLKEMLQWEPLAALASLMDERAAGAGWSLVPRFDAVTDLRCLLEQQMEEAVCALLAHKKQLQQDGLATAPVPPPPPPRLPLEDLKRSFKHKYYYDPDHFRLGFPSLRSLVDANLDLCSLDEASMGATIYVVPNPLMRLRCLVKALLRQAQADDPGAPGDVKDSSAVSAAKADQQRLAAVAEAVAEFRDQAQALAGATLDGPSGVPLPVIEQLYGLVFGTPFQASTLGFGSMADALPTLCDICALHDNCVQLAGSSGLESQVAQRMRLRRPRPPPDRFARNARNNNIGSVPQHAGGAPSRPPHASGPQVSPALLAPALPGSLGPMRRVTANAGWPMAVAPPPPPPPGRPNSGAASASSLLPGAEGAAGGLNPEVVALMMSDLAQAQSGHPPASAPMATAASGSLPGATAAAPAAGSGMSVDQIVAAALALGMQLPGASPAGATQQAAPAPAAQAAAPAAAYAHAAGYGQAAAGGAAPSAPSGYAGMAAAPHYSSAPTAASDPAASGRPVVLPLAAVAGRGQGDGQPSAQGTQQGGAPTHHAYGSYAGYGQQQQAAPQPYPGYQTAATQPAASGQQAAPSAHTYGSVSQPGAAKQQQPFPSAAQGYGFGAQQGASGQPMPSAHTYGSAAPTASAAQQHPMSSVPHGYGAVTPAAGQQAVATTASAWPGSTQPAAQAAAGRVPTGAAAAAPAQAQGAPWQGASAGAAAQYAAASTTVPGTTAANAASSAAAAAAAANGSKTQQQAQGQNPGQAASAATAPGYGQQHMYQQYAYYPQGYGAAGQTAVSGYPASQAQAAQAQATAQTQATAQAQAAQAAVQAAATPTDPAAAAAAAAQQQQQQQYAAYYAAQQQHYAQQAAGAQGAYPYTQQQLQQHYAQYAQYGQQQAASAASSYPGYGAAASYAGQQAQPNPGAAAPIAAATAAQGAYAGQYTGAVQPAAAGAQASAYSGMYQAGAAAAYAQQAAGAGQGTAYPSYGTMNP